MIASLPMYDWPEVQPLNDRLWAHIRDGLRADGLAAPQHLTRGGDLWAEWQSPDLLLGQTCGFPFRSRLHDKLTLVGTPDFALEGAPPGYYYSQLVVRADAPGDLVDFLGQRLAINGTDSQSGWAAVQNHVEASGRPFTRIVVTGAHRESAVAVIENRADIAGIDAVTWRLMQAYLPDMVAKLRTVAQTDPTPGLPLVTALGRDPKPLARAFAAAVASLAATDRQPLGLVGLVDIPAAAYLAVPIPRRPELV